MDGLAAGFAIFLAKSGSFNQRISVLVPTPATGRRKTRIV